MKQLASDASAGSAHMSRTLITVRKWLLVITPARRNGSVDLVFRDIWGETPLSSANRNKYIKIHSSAVHVYQVFFYDVHELVRCWV